MIFSTDWLEFAYWFGLYGVIVEVCPLPVPAPFLKSFSDLLKLPLEWGDSVAFLPQWYGFVNNLLDDCV